jgi:hypothetical protein
MVQHDVLDGRRGSPAVRVIGPNTGGLIVSDISYLSMAG